jgi:CheY-like chemotaxis protein
MDIKMPIMNGYDATQKIKEINPDIPIIACTAYVLDADKKRAKEAGCDAHISKPFKFSDLLPILKKYKK